MSALIDAMRQDDRVRVRRLMHEGANPDDCDKQGKTALMYVRTPEIAMMLLAAKAQLEGSCKSGCTALHYAVKNPLPSATAFRSRKIALLPFRTLLSFLFCFLNSYSQRSL
eukprot:TRINITY_DN19317_c0_g1_i10.p2 TRINITY_DN19317_c0_g1~~TRINITY_DN19317_c0_g1_i10.p2  ORF type:complete len:111 (+),score=13.00 TRINITY_DN19317_c0_g1_i10:144-476(+)